MKSYQRLFIFGLIVLGFTVIFSPWAAAVWDYVTNLRPGWQKYTFSKIFDRCFMLSGMILFFVFRRFLRLGTLREIGLVPRTRASGDFFLGALLAMGSMAMLTLTMSL